MRKYEKKSFKKSRKKTWKKRSRNSLKTHIEVPKLQTLLEGEPQKKKKKKKKTLMRRGDAPLRALHLSFLRPWEHAGVSWPHHFLQGRHNMFSNYCNNFVYLLFVKNKVREKSRECHNHKPQPFPDTKRKRKPTNPNKHKSNKRTKSTQISSLFPKRGNRNTKRTEKHKNKMTNGKTYNKSPRRINHKATKSKTNTGITALERSAE